MNDYKNEYNEEIVSDCCGAQIEYQDICGECKEHCGIQEWDDLDDTPDEMNDHLRDIGF